MRVGWGEGAGAWSWCCSCCREAAVLVGVGMAGTAPGWAGGYGGCCVVVVVVVVGGGTNGAVMGPFSAVWGVTPSALAALMGLWA